jgi:antagonist of KipI
LELNLERTEPQPFLSLAWVEGRSTGTNLISLGEEISWTKVESGSGQTDSKRHLIFYDDMPPLNQSPYTSRKALRLDYKENILPLMSVCIEPCGDRMVLIDFSKEISSAANGAVHHLAARLEKAPISGVLDWIPSYCSLGVIYDPLKIGYPALVEELSRLRDLETEFSPESTRRLEFPVAYGAAYGPDLAFVAQYHGLTPERVVALHTGAIYRVYMIGFTPGFPYLGGLPPILHTPRLANPRLQVPAGSVAIGGQQAGIYPITSPGGWRIIGRTPLHLFDIRNLRPALLKPGDEITFRAINKEEFDTRQAELQSRSEDAISHQSRSTTSSPVFRVASPGILSTLQDLGRTGYRQLGVSPCGGMDPLALRLANRLAGNPESVACLEVTLPGLQLDVLRDNLFAITGADLSAFLDDEPASLWQSQFVRAGQRLSFRKRVRGSRAYLAISGGFQADSVLGSCSTDLRNCWGGFQGRNLRKGDILFKQESPTEQSGLAIRATQPAVFCEYGAPFLLRVLPGPQTSCCLGSTMQRLFSEEFRVHPNSNRMGYRFNGPPLEVSPTEIISEPAPRGSIQVLPNGELVLLMADHQTVGGYPKIAVLISADFPKAAQLGPGHRVRFQAVNLEEAHRILALQEERVKIGVVGL